MKTLNHPRLAFSIKEVAQQLGVSPTSIRRAISRGQLRVCRKFRHLLIPADALQVFVSGELPLSPNVHRA